MTTTQTGQGQHVIDVYDSLDEARQAVVQLRARGNRGGGRGLTARPPRA
jgi:hypothetical protein